MQISLDSINMGVFLLWIASGFIAAFVARRSGILHGVILGLLSVVLMYLAPLLSREVHSYSFLFLLPIMLFSAAVQGGLGGFAWDIYNRLRRRYAEKKTGIKF